MNWTGGRLQRHSRNSAGKSLNYTQKQHFAKVRSKLQNGPRAVSPLDFSLLHAVRDTRDDRESNGEDSGMESRPKRQKTLCEYASTAALAHRLNAMKPRQVSHGRGSSSELRHRAKRPGPGSAANGSRAQYDVPARYRPSKTPSATPRDPMEDPRNHSHEVRLRSKPESSRRKVFPTPLVGNSSATKPGSLEDKRQNLLQQDDWVCTAITRPLKISFPGPNDREKVGRRRRISTEDHARRILPIPRRFQHSIQERLLPQTRGWEDRGGREDISVRIGGQVHGSQRTTLPGVEEVLSQSQHHSMSSESMLLDKEDTWYGAQGQVGLSPRTSVLGIDGQRLVPKDVLWPSRTNSASSSVCSSSSGEGFDGVKRTDKLQPEVYHFVEDEDEKGYGYLSHSGSVYCDEERSQASPKSSVQTLGHHQQIDIAEESLTETTDASAEYSVEDRAGLQSRDGAVPSKKLDDLTSRVPDAGPLRLIFSSTPQSHATSRLSDIGTTSNHNTQGIRSTVVEASDDTNDAMVKDSDEIEWEKLVMSGDSPRAHGHSKPLLPKADTSYKLFGMGQTNNKVVTTLVPGFDETASCQPNAQVAANDQPQIAPVDKVFINRNARLQTEDEIWMNFLDISGDTEEEDREHRGSASGHTLGQLASSDNSEIAVSYRRPANESILAQASSTSFTRTTAESSSLSMAHLASDTAHSRTEGLIEQTSSLSPHPPIRSVVATVNTSPVPFASDTYISTAATVRTSSPDPLAASTSTAPSIAAATAHSSSSGLPLPSTSLTLHQSDMRLPQPSRVSSPDPLTLTSPSAHVALHKKGHAATMQPPSPQRVLFTKPTPFTGRQVSATAIQKASRAPLHLGHAIAGSSSKPKSVPKHAKATPNTGLRKGRDKSRGSSRAAPQSIYSIPSTNSDIEDGSGYKDATESIEDEDTDLLEQI